MSSKEPSSKNRSKSDGATAASSSKIKQITKVGAFKDLYKIGSEVMASTHSYIKVLFAKRNADGEDYVVKIRMKPNCFRTGDDERSWRKRTEALLNLPLPSHIGICRLVEVVEDPEGYYIVMERVQGMDLFEAMGGHTLPLDVVREVLRHILASLRHLHLHNMIHKDLKLENVMISDALRGKGKKGGSKASAEVPIKIIDFDTLDEWTPTSASAKDVVGTDQYIAQEAYAGKYSPLSDIFAVGVIAYKMLSGKFPFTEDIFEGGGANWAGSPQMAVIRQRLKVCTIEYGLYSNFAENPLAQDLVSRMLSYNEGHRPTASVALQHPFFKEGDQSAAKAVSVDEMEDLIDDEWIIAESA
jgi:serine/threonine protein kinase